MYFSHILTFLKTPWPKAIKTLYTSAEIRGLCRLRDPDGFLLATRERPRTTAWQHSALGCWLGAEGKLAHPGPKLITGEAVRDFVQKNERTYAC